MTNRGKRSRDLSRGARLRHVNSWVKSYLHGWVKVLAFKQVAPRGRRFEAVKGQCRSWKPGASVQDGSRLWLTEWLDLTSVSGVNHDPLPCHTRYRACFHCGLALHVAQNDWYIMTDQLWSYNLASCTCTNASFRAVGMDIKCGTSLTA